jgi:hypothetical protein
MSIIDGTTVCCKRGVMVRSPSISWTIRIIECKNIAMAIDLKSASLRVMVTNDRVSRKANKLDDLVFQKEQAKACRQRNDAEKAH